MLFAVWNRPEMFKLVTESLVESYSYYPFPDLKFVFAVEAPNDLKVLELIEEFPFEVEAVLVRKQHAGLSRNILEAMKYAMEKTDQFMFFQADDIIVHKTFFKFYDTLLNMGMDKMSTCSLAMYKEEGQVNKVMRGHHYDAAGACINKRFWKNYILDCSNEDFYSNRPKFIRSLDLKYAEYHPELYKYKAGPSEHNQQAGLINRLVDVAMIKEDYFTIKSDLSRVRNIGFYGRNRPGAKLPGETFEQRLDYLRELIKDKSSIYNATATKRYSDYVNFDKSLDGWDGSIVIE
jgi:hypothetical protein